MYQLMSAPAHIWEPNDFVNTQELISQVYFNELVIFFIAFKLVLFAILIEYFYWSGAIFIRDP